jgi:hypothetical protein
VLVLPEVGRASYNRRAWTSAHAHALRVRALRYANRSEDLMQRWRPAYALRGRKAKTWRHGAFTPRGPMLAPAQACCNSHAQHGRIQFHVTVENTPAKLNPARSRCSPERQRCATYAALVERTTSRALCSCCASGPCLSRSVRCSSPDRCCRPWRAACAP